MKKLSILIVSCLCALGVSAQNVRSSNLSWSVTQLEDFNTNAKSSYTCVFESHGTKKIIWKQKGGAFNTTLAVGQVDGTWTDARAVGRMVYHITADGETGTLTIERTQSALYIAIDLSQEGLGRLKHRYTVSQVNALK